MCKRYEYLLGLVSLFWSSFLSATLLPGSSEVLLVSLLVAKVTGAVPLIIVATIGNTLGGMIQSGVMVHSATAKTTYRYVDRATLVTALWSGVTFVELGTGYWRRAMRGCGMAAHVVVVLHAFSVSGKRCVISVMAIVALQGVTLWS